jgi:hypothetical protein
MNYYTCILFFSEEINRRPTKYHNIRHLDNFKAFAATKGAIAINVYNKKTKAFVEQIKID